MVVRGWAGRGCGKLPVAELSASYRARSDSAALRTLVPDITEHDVYVCGPEQWMSAVRRAALGAGVAAAQIHLERFTY